MINTMASSQSSTQSSSQPTSGILTGASSQESTASDSSRQSIARIAALKQRYRDQNALTDLAFQKKALETVFNSLEPEAPHPNKTFIMQLFEHLKCQQRYLPHPDHTHPIVRFDSLQTPYFEFYHQSKRLPWAADDITQWIKYVDREILDYSAAIYALVYWSVYEKHTETDADVYKRQQQQLDNGNTSIISEIGAESVDNHSQQDKSFRESFIAASKKKRKSASQTEEEQLFADPKRTRYEETIAYNPTSYYPTSYYPPQGYYPEHQMLSPIPMAPRALNSEQFCKSSQSSSTSQQASCITDSKKMSQSAKEDDEEEGVSEVDEESSTESSESSDHSPKRRGRPAGRSSSKARSDKTPGTRPTVKCEECGIVFSRAFTYNRHVLGVHKSLKPFICTWGRGTQEGACGYSCSQRYQTLNHINHHLAGSKKYKNEDPERFLEVDEVALSQANK